MPGLTTALGSNESVDELTARGSASPPVDERERGLVDRGRELDANVIAGARSAGSRTSAAAAALRRVGRGELAVATTAGGPRGGQEGRAGELGELDEGPTADTAEQSAVEPDVPAVAAAQTRHERVVAAQDEGAGRRVDLPGIGLRIPEWPEDPALLHGDSDTEIALSNQSTKEFGA